MQFETTANILTDSNDSGPEVFLRTPVERMHRQRSDGQKTSQGVIVKSLLSRKGTVLDNAPTFLLRPKANTPIHFVTARANDTGHDESTEAPASPAPTRVTPLRAVMPSTQSSARPLQAAAISEVEWLLQQSVLTLFRSFDSFAYSASLLFHPRDLSFYAVLYHEEAVWRALKAVDADAAELAFRHFVEQATRLAEAETRRAILEAQNEQFKRSISETEAQVERVRVDLQQGSSRDQEVALRQQEIRKELAQLEGRRVASQVQLTKLQRQLHQLNASSNDCVPHLPSNR